MNLMEAAAWQVSIEVVCRCGYRASFDPHGLWWFEQRRWNNRLSAAIQWFSCCSCAERLGKRLRPTGITVVRGSDADIALPMPPEREWRRVVKRLRY